jgi:hypothetical protein
MKIAVLIAAAALASGSALAASNSSSYETHDTATTHKAPVVDKDKLAAREANHKEGIVERTKDAIRHTGEKLGHAMDRVTRKVPRGHTDQASAANDPSRSDTRAMGAAASDDSARQRRMDEAYNDWNARHQK